MAAAGVAEATAILQKPMKHTYKILLGSLILSGAQFALSGCGGGYVEGGGTTVVYGGGAWFHDDVWVDGGGRRDYGDGRGGGGGAYVHPAAAPRANVNTNVNVRVDDRKH